MPTEAFWQYVAYERRLQSLIDQGQSDSPEAEELRDLMDPVWWRMSPVERDKINASVRHYFFASEILSAFNALPEPQSLSLLAYLEQNFIVSNRTAEEQQTISTPAAAIA
jgi:hypothetical protein